MNDKIDMTNFVHPECWECTSRLRTKKDEHQPGVVNLQQLWVERTTGKYEWRDVPTEEECDIK